MKILIRTLPLRSGNYGGILQAWALQQVLKDLGADPVTDVSARPANRMSRTLAAIGRPTRNLLPSRLNILPGDARWRGDVNVRAFVRDEVSRTSLFRPYARKPRRRVMEGFDAFVVGSDQVWRSAYADVSSYLLDFLPPEDRRIKVAYAASFGSIEDNAWSTQTITRMSALMGRFDALSCREDSGTRWIADSMGLDAPTVPDPTLLLEVGRYEHLIRRSGALQGTPSGRYVLTYLLDSSPELSAEVNSVASGLRADVLALGNSGAAEHSGPRPSPAEWLHLIANAELVVTDSFHGMLFSALLGTPHAVTPNGSRGIARFYSLADMLATEGVIAENAGDVRDIAEDFGRRVEQSTTGHRLEAARNLGLGFLRESLRL